MKTRKYLNMKKAPKTLGFKGFSEILINFFIISLRTEVRDEQPSDRTKHLYGAFFLDITGFFAFSVVGCPIP